MLNKIRHTHIYNFIHLHRTGNFLPFIFYFYFVNNLQTLLTKSSYQLAQMLVLNLETEQLVGYSSVRFMSETNLFVDYKLIHD